MTNFDELFNIQDDLAVSEESYPQQDNGFKPPLPGNYSVKPLTWEFQTDKKGNIIRWKDQNGVPTYPLIKLNMLEIVEPIENGRKVGMFQQIVTAPNEREGRLASQAADLLVAMDDTVNAASTGEVLRTLTERLTNQSTFRGRLDYAGYDGDYANAEIEKAGGKDNLDRKALNLIYKNAKIQGYKRIQAANAKAGQPKLPLHKWVGPSGNTVDVTPIFTIFHPSSSTVQLGPDKNLLTVR